MKEGILGPKVENVAIAVVKEECEKGESGYNVYLLNFRGDITEGILVTSRGHGVDAVSGEAIKTSTLRHCIELMLPNEGARLEPIMEDVFGLTNEYLLSFWINEKMYDKKYIFVPGTIADENMVEIPLLGKIGVLIK